MNDLDWYWFDARGRWVFFAVRAQLALDAEVDVAYTVLSDVLGPQAGKRLPHCTQGVFHSASPDGLTAGSGSAVTVAGAPDLEERDGIGNVAEEGIKLIGNAKVCPAGPMVVSCRGT
jgi:hypothetical protein